MGARPDLIPIFAAVWFALGISNACYFYFNNNAAQKRRVLPFVMFGMGLLFLIFASFITPVSLVIMGH